MTAAAGSTEGPTSRLPALGSRGEGWVAVQGALVITVVGAGLLGPRWRAPRATRVAGAVLAAGGTALMATAMRALGDSFTPNPRPKAEGVLRRDSVFGMARHPIYGGIMLSSFGGALLTSPAAVPPAAALSGFLALKSQREEAWLAEQFPGYAQYRHEVRRRFIPGVA